MVFGPEVFERLERDLAARRPRAYAGPPRRRAGVLIPLFAAGPEVHVVLGKRSDHLRSHPGEVAFPGGRMDPSDASLQAAALREAAEEVAIDPRSVRVIGRLDDMPTAGSGFVIRPFVSQIPTADGLVADGVEIERILTPPLAVFADPARRRDAVRERDGVAFPVTYFDVGSDVVWGATARMLVALVDVLQGREPPPVPVIPVPAG